MRRKKIFWGVFFLAAAVLLVAGNFLDIYVSDLLIMLAMVIFLIEGILYRNFALILFPVAIVLIVNNERLGLPEVSPWSFLAAALFGSIGLSVLFPKRRQYYVPGMKIGWGSSADSWKDFVGSAGGGAEEEMVDGEAVYLENSFGDTIKFITSRKLGEAHLRNAFGNMVVYFNNAELMDHTAYVKVNTSFGSIVLHIPASWKVNVTGNTAFGSIAEKGQCNPDGENVLEVSGNISFGVVRIQYI